MIKDWMIAHRGAQKNARENTIAAFQEALDSDANQIEFDIHTTKDGFVICNHDPDIKGLNIKQSNYKELKKIQADLATFNEAIRLIGEKKPIVVEVKSTETTKHIIKILDHHKNWRITSFKIEIIKELIDSGIDRRRLILLQDHHSFGQIRKARKLGVGGVSINQRLMTPRLYWRAIDNNLEIYAWVVNSPLQAKLFRLLYPKLYIFTDRPDVLQSIK